MNEQEDLRHDLMVDVAKMYYLENISQEEIAKRVHLSRPSISRIIKSCFKEGIVQIRINETTSYGKNLAEQLRKKYNLQAVIVAPYGHSEETAKEKVGAAAAGYLQNILTENMLIGIAWGTTIYSMAHHIAHSPYIKADVIQLLGGRNNQTNDTDGDLTAHTLAKALNGKCYTMQAPFMVQSKILRDLLMEEPGIKSHFEKIMCAAVAVVGFGTVKPLSSAQFRSGHISIDEVNKLDKSGVVGDICGTYIDINGKICINELNDRMIAISLERLKQIPTVIGIASGKEKTPIITGVLRGGYVNVLVIDEHTAGEVLGYD